MIFNPDSILVLQTEWAGVIRMRERMQLLVTATFAGGAFTAPALANVVYNLPLLLAYDVLRQVLTQARDQGIFSCSRNQLGNLMDSSKDSIQWINWENLRAGIKRRNEVAHDGKLFESKQCLQDIRDIEVQLIEWGIIVAT